MTVAALRRLVVLLCCVWRKALCFTAGSVGFSSNTVKVPLAITVNFTATWTLRPDEIVQIFLPRFTRRLTEDLHFATNMPSRSPTATPTRPPGWSFSPTPTPSLQPSKFPTVGPTPLGVPTVNPTAAPTPTFKPTGQPSGQPTRQPTRRPSRQPTGQPSRRPSSQPTGQPSRQPSVQPTSNPSFAYYPRHRSRSPLAQPTTATPTQYYGLRARQLDISWGSLIISPSTIFEGAWVEGDWKNYNSTHKETNYPGGMVTLRRAAQYNTSIWLEQNQTVSLVIHAENGIGAYCGFASSANPDSQSRFDQLTNHGGLNVNFDERFLVLTNYSVYPWEGNYPIHGWPNQLYSGLKNRLLPNVSYTFPVWQGLGPGCSQLPSQQGCSGHGVCDYCSNRCSCFEGYGSSRDLLLPGMPAAPDCSQRTCPSGKALADAPLYSQYAHRKVECSNAGICDRATGTCKCFPPWTGAACNRMRCPNDCSGHGTCLSIRQIARLASIKGGRLGGVYWGHAVNYGLDLNTMDNVKFNDTQVWEENSLSEFTNNAIFVNAPNGAGTVSLQNNVKRTVGSGGVIQISSTQPLSTADTTAWDHDTFFACVCDSSWPAGLEPGQTQLSEWFGPDCSQRHCPSGDDPYTSYNELHCTGKNQISDSYPEKGAEGNYCHVDCSNRGVCDFSTGVCKCFPGSYGANCGVVSRTGVYADAQSAPPEDYQPPFNKANGNQTDVSATQQIDLGPGGGAVSGDAYY